MEEAHNECSLEELYEELEKLYNTLFSYSINKESIKENLNGELKFDICRNCKCHGCSDLKKAVKNSTNTKSEELSNNLFTLKEQMIYLMKNGESG